MVMDTPIRNLRKKAKKTKREIATALGVTELAYSRWESGLAEPSGGNLVRLLSYFRSVLKRPGLDVTELFGSEAK